jgi:hypothetical protein
MFEWKLVSSILTGSPNILMGLRTDLLKVGDDDFGPKTDRMITILSVRR